MAEKKKGVLILAFGGADSLESIPQFIKNVLKGRPVTPEMIEKALERYRLIGGKSPLLDITNAQAAEVQRLIGPGYKAYVGMRYWHPFIKETLSKMREDGIEESVALIMAPFASRVSTGGYQKDVEEAQAESETAPKIRFIIDWHTHPLFIEAVLEKLNAALKPFADPKDCLVIFSNHSLPVPALAGDPYVNKIQETVNEITSKIALDYRIAYQSQGSGPMPWLGPKTEDVIAEAKKLGKKGVVIVPLGFAADHVETLYDIDIHFKETAKELGLTFSRSGSLNTSPKFMELIASLVKNNGV